MNPQQSTIVLFLVGQLVTAGGTYAAIRADLREALVTATAAAYQAEKAHARIDGIINRNREN